MPFSGPAIFREDSGAGAFMRGAAWMVLAMAGFAATIGMIRHVTASVDPFVVVFFRNLFGLAFMVPWLIRVGAAGLRTGRLGLHMTRATIGLIAMLLWYSGLAHVPIAEAVALNFTAPLFTTVLAIPFLGEKVGIRRWSATVVGFLGVLVVLRPGAEAVSSASLLILLASLFMAEVGICIKKLSSTESNETIVTYMVLILTPISLIPALFVWEWPDWASLGWMAGIGGISTMSQMCLARAFRSTEASALMPFDYTRLPFVALIGFVAFGEVPDMWTWIGAGIIAAAGIYIARREVVVGRLHATPLTAGDQTSAASAVERKKPAD